MENKKNKLLYRFLSLILALLLAFNPLVIPLAWAEGEEQVYPEGTEGPAEEQVVQQDSGEEPSEEPQEEPQEEPASEPDSLDEAEMEDGGDSTIITGDAESLAEVETIANTNVDCVPGEISAPDDPCTPPEVETECPDDVEISHDNLADVSDSATSSATTGDNEIMGAGGDALIDTGDATAGASIENEVNTNIALFEDSGGIVEDNEPSTVEIENANEGTLVNQADVLADTGENQANENEGNATIETGEALAYANILNLLNTNIVGSDFEILLLNYLQGHQGDIDLNELWQEILGEDEEGLKIAGDDFDSFLIQNDNLAHLENDVDVVANSGDNQANENEDDASIKTGDATALANVVNFVNLNLVGSKFFLGVVNIFGEFLGDLILPRPEGFMNDGSGEDGNQSPVIFQNQNLAEVDDSVEAVAETGTNAANNNGGDSFIGTGNATSQANSFVLVNTNIGLNNWFFLLVNPLGSWLGKIFGWSAPEAVEESVEDQAVFQLGPDSQNGGEDGGPEDMSNDDLSQNVVQNQNEAHVENDIHVQASTGQNQASGNDGDAEIETGNARALANLFDFINLNIWGSRWFFGLVNILGDWTGNVIFAHPEVAVTLTNGTDRVTPGEIYEYTLNFVNQGHDEANDVVLQLELPEGVIFLGDSSGLTPQVSGRNYVWYIGSLGAGQAGAFQIVVQISPDFSPEESPSFLSKIIPVAHAAESETEREIITTASIGTSDPESDLSNNTASAKTIVYFSISEEPGPGEEGPEDAKDDGEESGGEGGVDQRLPELEITAWNNVGEFVYPGDTVTFEITIRNTGEVPSYDTYIIQELFNGVPEESFGTAGFEIGTLEPGKGAKLTFGLKLADNGALPAGPYYTIARALGFAPNGSEVSSNEARTEFEIKLKKPISMVVPEVQAARKEEEILGMSSPECPECETDILPYVLLMILSSLWLVNFGKMRLKKEQE